MFLHPGQQASSWQEGQRGSEVHWIPDVPVVWLHTCGAKCPSFFCFPPILRLSVHKYFASGCFSASTTCTRSGASKRSITARCSRSVVNFHSRYFNFNILCAKYLCWIEFNFVDLHGSMPSAQGSREPNSSFAELSIGRCRCEARRWAHEILERSSSWIFFRHVKKSNA